MFKFNERNKKKLMSLELLNKRLNYRGGNQQQRMINDKLVSLKRALLYSYQAATAILPDNRQFRGLINPDKNKPAYDNKILSIPYKDICLNTPKVGKTTQGEVDINLKPGQVFIWKENNTHWLVYLQDPQEDAYFRAEIRKCEAQAVLQDGSSYWIYIRGPVQTDIRWHQKSEVSWNNLNYSIIIYITADEVSRKQIERFSKIKIFDSRKKEEKTWEVAAVDEYYGDGILQVALNEFFENSIEQEIKKEKENPINYPEDGAPYIEGSVQIPQYSRERYTIKNASGGKWYIQRTIKTLNEETQEEYDEIEETLLQTEEDSILLNSYNWKGKFILIYRIDGEQDIVKTIQIVTL